MQSNKKITCKSAIKIIRFQTPIINTRTKKSVNAKVSNQNRFTIPFIVLTRQSDNNKSSEEKQQFEDNNNFSRRVLDETKLLPPEIQYGRQQQRTTKLEPINENEKDDDSINNNNNNRRKKPLNRRCSFNTSDLKLPSSSVVISNHGKPISLSASSSPRFSPKCSESSSDEKSSRNDDIASLPFACIHKRNKKSKGF